LQPTFNNQSNHHLTMEYNQNSADEVAAEDQGQNRMQPIKVMGMDVDRQFITGLLDSLPPDEQRDLSRVLLKIVFELFPDLPGELQQVPQVDSDSPPDEYEGHDDGYDYPDSDKGEDRGDRNAKADNYGVEASGSSSFSYDDEPGAYGNADVDEEYYSQAQGGMEDEQEDNEAGYGSDDPNEDGDGEDESDTDTADWQGNEHCAVQVPVFKLDSDKASAGSYLDRFRSPRISRGMSIWEELAVTVPSFMESYLTRYAAGHLISAQLTARGAGGLVTFHLLFHRTNHRRPICRLLDLVLEAEEGLLGEADFKEDGALDSHTVPVGKAGGGNAQTYSHRKEPKSEGYEDWEEEGGDPNDTDPGMVDYECYASDPIPAYGYSHDTGASWGIGVGQQYVSAGEVAAIQRSSAILQIMGIDTSGKG
jgi:hypothetical protein